jgi:hypothetical protein
MKRAGAPIKLRVSNGTPAADAGNRLGRAPLSRSAFELGAIPSVVKGSILTYLGYFLDAQRTKNRSGRIVSPNLSRRADEQYN